MAGVEGMLSELNQLKDQVNSLSETMNTTFLGMEENLKGEEEDSGEQYNIEFLDWAANRGTEFEYGENPFDDMRVAWLSELVTQLNKTGFAGVVSLKAHYGNFCLSESGTGALVLAADDLKIEDCLFSAESQAADFSQTSYQTLGFANYVSSVLADKDTPIEVVVESDEFSVPLQPYPEIYAVKTAGAWNQVAVQNQRIQVSLYPTVVF
jgi:hypothetical protein